MLGRQPSLSESSNVPHHRRSPWSDVTSRKLTRLENAKRLRGERRTHEQRHSISDETLASGALIVVSNRLPFKLVREGPDKELKKYESPGGLVTALEPVLSQKGGIWFGWPGIDMGDSEKVPSGDKSYSCEPVLMTEEEINLYYLGFSNKTLWPLMHCMPERTTFNFTYYDMYCAINKRFATVVSDRLCTTGSLDNLIWVHDYQLLLFSQYLRELLPTAKLAYFHHIPWPPYTIYCTLPWAAQILKSMLACDLIGFHVQSYVSNFIDCCLNTLEGAYYNSQYRVIHYNNRFTKIDQFPIGCPYDDLNQEAQKAKPDVLNLHASGTKIILGCDRLDYTKGITERLLAFELFLEMFPENINKVVLFQIAVPSREDVTEYVTEKKAIEEAVGRINGKYATTSWSPIHYLYRSFPRSELAAIYRDSHVALITPLRDGMNLVCKEYVACQTTEPGVLILSLLAGAAQELESAILVNPYDVWEVARQIQRALCMTEAERSIRIQSLQSIVKENDVYNWVNKFLNEAVGMQVESSVIPRPDRTSGYREYLFNYMFGHKLCLFITYDGTLAPFCEKPELAFIPDDMRKAMVFLLSCPNVSVTIVSGRTVADVKKMAQLNGVRYVGSHGFEFEVSKLDSDVYEHLAEEQDKSRVTEAARLIEEAGLNRDGAWTEIKGPIMTYHYRQVEDQDEAKAMKEKVHQLLVDAGLKARAANKAIEGVPFSDYDKGSGILRMLEISEGAKWFNHTRCVYIGDDIADEEAFARLKGLALTFKVSSPCDTLTQASYVISNETNELQSLLDYIARIMQNNVVPTIPSHADDDQIYFSES